MGCSSRRVTTMIQFLPSVWETLRQRVNNNDIYVGTGVRGVNASLALRRTLVLICLLSGMATGPSQKLSMRNNGTWTTNHELSSHLISVLSLRCVSKCVLRHAPGKLGGASTGDTRIHLELIFRCQKQVSHKQSEILARSYQQKRVKWELWFRTLRNMCSELSCSENSSCHPWFMFT